MNIIGFSNDTGSVHWRLQSPANYINALTNHEYYVTSHKNWNDDTLGADIIVAQMWRNPKALEVCRAQGAKIVYEADDIIVGVGGKDRQTLMRLTPEQEQQTIATIAGADLVTVTTNRLAEHYRQFNKNVVVIPNYMDFLWWGKPWRARPHGVVRLGWAGSTSHREDLLMIEPIIKRVLKEYPFVKFVYCGTGGVKNMVGEELFKSLPANQKEFYMGVPLEYWPHKFKSLCIDVAVAPLVDDEFNAGKSPIKYYEYAANHTPAVFSDSVVYHDAIQSGVTGFLAKNEEEWFTHISRLILEENTNNKIRLAAYNDVLNKYAMADHYQEWIAAFESLYA